MAQSPPTTSVREEKLPSTPLVSTISENWEGIAAYFMEMRLAQDETARNKVAARLPQVGLFLQAILDTLMKERTKMALAEPLSRSQFSESDEVSRNNRRTCSFTMTSHADYSQSHKSNGATGERSTSLPPCHAFLWGDAPLISYHEEGNTETEGEFSSIGNVFLPSLCQFAKHNDPPGSRLIILRFLARLIFKADLPRTPHMGELPRSLLQMFPSNMVVPIVDLICHVGPLLRPCKEGGEDTDTILASPAPEDNIDTLGDERAAFLTLLCALAERMEQVPALAPFFLPADSGDGVSTKPVQEVSSVDEISFVLFRELLVYVAPHRVSSEAEKRNDICHLALRGLLSLAKCPDVTVQDYVSKHTSVASLTLTWACTILLRLCKVSDNDDGAAQLAFLGDILSFWSQLLLFAPAVAKAWGIEQLIEDAFLRDTLLPLFLSADDTVYTTVTTVTARMVHIVGRAPPFFVSTLTRALFTRCFDPLTEKVVQAPSDSQPSLSTLVSFLDHIFLPRLVVQKSETNCRCMEATLYLIQTLALYEPTLFMEFVLSLSVSTLSEIYIKGLCHSAKLGRKRFSDVDDVDNNKVDSDTITRAGEGLTESMPLLSSPSAVTEMVRHVDCYQPPELDVDLSAASTSPPLNVSECFSARLRTTKGTLFNDTEPVVEDVVARLLLIESHVPSEVLIMRQCIINGTCRNANREFTKALLEKSGHPGVSFSMSFALQDEKDVCRNSLNIWFHEGVHHSSLVLQLCELTLHLLTLPSGVCALLTKLWSTLCVLPDLRVLYTLMDPKHGRLRQTLLGLRDIIDKGMQDDEDITFALASAAAAFAAAGKGKKNFSALRFEAVPHEEHAMCKTNTNLGLVIKNTAPCLYTRSYLYSQFTQIGSSLHWIRDVVEQESTNHELLTALKRHRVFLEACVCVEGFRMELDAVVGHMELSHNLMCLQTGK